MRSRGWCGSRASRRIPTLVTHLASADEVEDPKTQQQLDSFDAATRGLPGERSIANSAAILAWPASRRDWVRPGLMLYGASPFPGGSGADIGLRPVMTFQTEVIAVKTVEAGETVGYGGAWRAARRTSMAVVAVGYGDGYPRSARPGTPLLVDGQRAPLIGRVSMDMITADVTGMPGVRVGAPVELWGGMLPIEEVARSRGQDSLRTHLRRDPASAADRPLGPAPPPPAAPEPSALEEPHLHARELHDVVVVQPARLCAGRNAVDEREVAVPAALDVDDVVAVGAARDRGDLHAGRPSVVSVFTSSSSRPANCPESTCSRAFGSVPFG